MELNVEQWGQGQSMSPICRAGAEGQTQVAILFVMALCLEPADTLQHYTAGFDANSCTGSTQECDLRGLLQKLSKQCRSATCAVCAGTRPACTLG